MIVFAFCLFIGSCKREKGESLPVIDVAGGLGTYRQVPMSEHVSEVEYIPLETGKDFMIDESKNFNLIATTDRIFVAGLEYCYVFTRQGKFVCKVGSMGRGPGEYNIVAGITVNEESRIVYLDSVYELLEYSWNGEFIRSIEKPMREEADAFGGGVITDEIALLRDNLFLGNIENNTGDEPNRWVLFDDIGTTVKAFPQPIRLNKETGFSSGMFGASEPFVRSGVAWVKEILNDTLYKIDHSLDLVPKLVFDLGRYAFPRGEMLTYGNIDEFRERSVNLMEGTNIPMIITDKYLFFSANVGKDIQSAFNVPDGVERTMNFQGQQYQHNDTGTVLGLYDFADNRTVFLDRDPISRRFGLVNDIDGGLSFWPRCYTYDDELVQVLSAFEMKDVLTEEYFAAHPAKDPAAHKRLRTLLENLKEDDNPVIVIAKLKK